MATIRDMARAGEASTAAGRADDGKQRVARARHLVPRAVGRVVRIDCGLAGLERAYDVDARGEQLGRLERRAARAAALSLHTVACFTMEEWRLHAACKLSGPINNDGGPTDP